MATFRQKFKAKKKPKRAKGRAKAKPAKLKDPGRSDIRQGSYSPKVYSDRATAFIKCKRKDGATNSEAQEMWLQSHERATMLANLSVGELKRRRFVPKGTVENPFAAKLGGA